MYIIWWSPPGNLSWKVWGRILTRHLYTLSSYNSVMGACMFRLQNDPEIDNNCLFCQKHDGSAKVAGIAAQGLPPKMVAFTDATAQKAALKAP